MITDKELIAKISEDVRYDLAILKDDTLLLESSYSNWKDEIDDKKKYWKKIRSQNMAKAAALAPSERLRSKYWKRAQAASQNIFDLDTEFAMNDRSAKIKRKKELMKKLKGGSVAGGVSTGLILAAITAATYKLYKNNVTAARRACKKFKGSDRDDCILRYKIKSLERQNEQLERQKKQCDLSTDPKKCKDAVDDKITRNKDKIKQYKDTLEVRWGIKQ